MASGAQALSVSKKQLWAGRIISALPVLLLLFSGVMKLLKPTPVLQGFAHYGYPESLIVVIGILEIACTLVYVIPQSSYLGAILMTAYLGGATASNVRVATHPTSLRSFSACWSGQDFTYATLGCAHFSLFEVRANGKLRGRF